MVLQRSCPLFTAIPAEMQNRIYEFSLESDDSTYTAHPKRISTSLLQTCQQIYAEVSLLPPAINEHAFWCYRPPPHVKTASSHAEYFKH
ncbi:hypothetical protein CVT25_009766 [Psilocybe cyanescens]|uniref:Uncharacterized protein n=1 Tax=Psilocybe cyanescens TaxID=93625 RepID=A0A409XQ16_PSICY|nr:hypothetical protein CVT25_009766 [Psilocybe cyanescens]